MLIEGPHYLWVLVLLSCGADGEWSPFGTQQGLALSIKNEGDEPPDAQFNTQHGVLDPEVTLYDALKSCVSGTAPTYLWGETEASTAVIALTQRRAMLKRGHGRRPRDGDGDLRSEALQLQTLVPLKCRRATQLWFTICRRMDCAESFGASAIATPRRQDARSVASPGGARRRLGGGDWDRRRKEQGDRKSNVEQRERREDEDESEEEEEEEEETEEMLRQREQDERGGTDDEDEDNGFNDVALTERCTAAAPQSAFLATLGDIFEGEGAGDGPKGIVNRTVVLTTGPEGAGTGLVLRTLVLTNSTQVRICRVTFSSR
jgi:hypothetical protein